MTRQLLGCGCACAMALTVSLGAQSQTAPATPPAQQPSAMSIDQGAMVTVEGCLVKETKVPGRDVPERERTPTVADEDYVLTDTKMIKGSAPQPEAQPNAPQPPDAPVGTSGAAAAATMFKVKSETLKMGEHAGRRVQIDGMFTHEKRADNPTVFAYDLVKLNGMALREVPGDCPKK